MQIQSTDAHMGAVQATLFLNDHLYTGGSDRMIRVWDNACQKIAEANTSEGVLSLCGLGGRLYSGGREGGIRVWKLSGDLQGVDVGKEGGPIVAMAACDQRLLCSGGAKTVSVWEGEPKRKVRELSGHEGSVTSLLSLDGDMVLSGASEGTIRVWDLRAASCRHTLKEHQAKVSSLVAFPHNKAQFLSGSSDRNIHLWDLRAPSKPLMGRIRRANGEISALAIHEKGSHLISASLNMLVQLWDLDHFPQFKVLESSAALSLALRGDHLAVGDKFGTLVLFDLSHEGVREKKVLEPLPHIEGYADYNVPPIKGVEKGKICYFQLHQGQIKELGFHAPYGISLGGEGEQREVKVWRVDIDTARPTQSKLQGLLTLPDRLGEVLKIGLLPHQEAIYTVSQDKVALYPAKDPAECVGVYSVKGGDTIACVAHTESVIALGTVQGHLHLFDIPTKKGRCLNEGFSWFKKPPMMALATSKEEMFALDRKGDLWSCPLNGENLEKLASLGAITSTRVSLFVVDSANKLIAIIDDKVHRFKMGRRGLEPLGVVTVPVSDRFAISNDAALLAGSGQNRVFFWDLIRDQRVEERDVCLNLEVLSSSRLMSTLALSPCRDLWVYGDDRGGITVSALGIQKEQQALNPDIPLIKKNDIIERKKLKGAKGSFGQVYTGKWHGMEVAYKKLVKTQDPEEQRAAFINEVNVMWKVRHERLAILYGVCLEPYGIVMGLETGGTLHKLLHENKEPLPWLYRYQLSLDIAHGLRFLHANQVFHRDLKSDNILLDDKRRAKITDFGLAKIPSYFNTLMSEQSGAHPWQAPEVLEGVIDPLLKRIKYGPASDVYSLGMVLYEIALRKLPFDNRFSIKDVVERGGRPDVEALPVSLIPLKELMKQCWETEREKRPQMEQILHTLSTLEKEVPNPDLAPPPAKKPEPKAAKAPERPQPKQLAVAKPLAKPIPNAVAPKAAAPSSPVVPQTSNALQLVDFSGPTSSSLSSVAAASFKPGDSALQQPHIDRRVAESSSARDQQKATSAVGTDLKPAPSSHPSPIPVGSPLEIIKKEEIQVGKEMNLGAHCRLSEGVWKKHPVTVREFFTQGLFDSIMQGKLLEEAKRLRALSHPNLLQLYAITFDSGLLVVEEGAAGVPLSQEIAKLNPEMRKQAARQIAEAVAYLHAQGLRHEGLYTDGVLITPQGVAKISDLGFREVRSHLSSSGHTTRKQGRAAFSAPELAEDPPKPSEKSDIFALGMIFYELFVGMPPFGADKDPQISRKIGKGLRPTFLPTFNPKDKALIEACWNQDPAGRPTIVKVNQELKL